MFSSFGTGGQQGGMGDTWGRVPLPNQGPTSPAFNIFGARYPTMQGVMQHYPSPPAQHVSPAPVSTHWTNQLMKYDSLRALRSPWHRARSNALTHRNPAKNAITITNPNAVKPPEVSSERPPTPQADHPSSTAAPISETPRLKSARPESPWNSLDMGGVQLKLLPPVSGLWKMTFLVQLYLNHNALTSLPPQISKLRHLEILDISGNNLHSLPAEIGMLTFLKELFFFDNAIQSIPPEFGTLHQLQTLGVEGNPLDANLKKMIQSDGTRSLIAFLRDSCPVPTPPPQRPWETPTTESNLDPDVETFTVFIYNILSEHCATETLYGYTPAWALAWEYRRDVILNEILQHSADFLCLQEVEVAQFPDYFVKNLEPHGYEGVFAPKLRYARMSESDPQRRAVEGCATFFKKDKYMLLENHVVEFRTLAIQREDFQKNDDMFNRVFQKEQIALVSLLERRDTGTRVVLANTHIEWRPTFNDVKIVQVALLIEEVKKLADHFAKMPVRDPDDPSLPKYSDGSKIPIIVSGDFNSIPESGLYEFLDTGKLAAKHPDWLGHQYGMWTEKGMSHDLNLKSAYACIGELPSTNLTPSFCQPVDYIWYSTPTLGVSGVLGRIDEDYLEKVVGLPNPHFPSDHICLMAEFRVKPPRA